MVNPFLISQLITSYKAFKMILRFVLFLTCFFVFLLSIGYLYEEIILLQSESLILKGSLSCAN